LQYKSSNGDETLNGSFEALAGLATRAVLVVALPGWCLDVGGAPRRLVAELAARLVAAQSYTSVAADGRVFLVVTVGLATVLAVLRVLVAVLATCTRATDVTASAVYCNLRYHGKTPVCTVVMRWLQQHFDVDLTVVRLTLSGSQ